jgi:hypothetical protein
MLRSLTKKLLCFLSLLCCPYRSTFGVVLCTDIAIVYQNIITISSTHVVFQPNTMIAQRNDYPIFFRLINIFFTAFILFRSHDETFGRMNSRLQSNLCFENHECPFELQWCCILARHLCHFVMRHSDNNCQSCTRRS